MRTARLVLVLAVTLIGASSTSGRALPTFDALFAFGDSLSDIGNDYIGTSALGIVPAIPPAGAYYKGRFSNGYVGVEYLWYLMSHRTPGTNGALKPFLGSPAIPQRGGLSFAFGGADTALVTNMGEFSVPGLGGQVALYAAAERYRPAPRRSLHVVMSGANDYLPSPVHPVQMNPAIPVDNIVKAIKGLYLTGARHIMVVDLPDLGAIPLVSRPEDAQLKGLLTLLSAQHNTLLAQALNDLRLPWLTLYPVHIRGAEDLLPPLLEPPALAALTGSPEAAVCIFAPATCPTLTPAQFQQGSAFFYWDAEHPTTTVHAAIGQHLFNALQ
jgi:phospholipase/lecithinase/hemolysin